MSTKKINYQTFIIVAAVLLTTAVACTPDGVPANPAGGAIYESEQLQLPAAVELPANPTGYTRVATYYAEGVQKYKAQQKAGTTGLSWVFVAPQANLFNVNHKKVGTHSAGPTWQLLHSTTDSIYGQQMAPPRSAPSPDPNSIDWLLLIPKVGTVPTGVFTDVAYIQRIATKGGKAPATPPASILDTIDVRYTAVYRFSKKNP
jgi:hypothetical protein